MEKKRLIKLLAVAAFTISIQLISVYATPDSNEQIVVELPTVDETATVVSLNAIKH